MKAPILDPSFVWIPAATHDASSEMFRERQRQRMERARLEREANEREAQTKVRRIKK